MARTGLAAGSVASIVYDYLVDRPSGAQLSEIYAAGEMRQRTRGQEPTSPATIRSTIYRHLEPSATLVFERLAGGVYAVRKRP